MNRVGLFANSSKPHAIFHAEQAARLLLDAGAECCGEHEVVSQFSNEIQRKIEILPIEDFDKFADIMMSFGGDGTMLRASRLLLQSDIPTLGINLGTLGFLTEFSSDEIEQAVSAVLSGEYVVEDRTLAEAQTQHGFLYALNDFVFHRGTSSHMLRLRVRIDGNDMADFRADGLIIATPTGSTAYSLATGGPIVSPTCSVFCLTPVSPHMLTLRPIVVPDSAEIMVEAFNEGDSTLLSADGQEGVSLRSGDVLYIRRSENVFKLVKRRTRNYYDVLKSKLLWATDSFKK